MGFSLEEKAREISVELAFEQPRLSVSVANLGLLIEGQFDLKPRKAELSHCGKLDDYTIKLELPNNFPKGEPKLFETLGRIPRDIDRHVNSDGSCCFGVWEAWCALAEPVTFQKFLGGPVRDFFFSQHYYECHNKWPYGEYQHGERGLLQSYAEVLRCEPKVEIVRYRLRLFSQDWPKGHWDCVCESQRKLRECCSQVQSHPPVSRKSAMQMKKRFDKCFKV